MKIRDLLNRLDEIDARGNFGKMFPNPDAVEEELTEEDEENEEETDEEDK